MQFHVAQMDFLRFCAVERRLSRHTLSAYEFDLLDFRRWLGPGTPPGLVSEESLKSYLENMVSCRGLSPATVRRRFACLRSFFRRLCDFGEANDPFRGWKPKLPRKKRLPRALARSESVTLFKSLALYSGRPSDCDRQFRTAFRLMVATGIRVGELCGLKLADISPDCAAIRIHGKGSKDRITYVADLSLREALRELIAWRRLKSGDSATLLINRVGSPMKPQSVRTKLRGVATEAGVARRITPHMLRHTAATLLIENGVDIRFVQRLLGHSSIATTEIYTHVTDEALRATLERANVLELLKT